MFKIRYSTELDGRVKRDNIKYDVHLKSPFLFTCFFPVPVTIEHDKLYRHASALSG